LTEDGLELIVVDGGKGLLCVLPLVYPKVPIQRCWVHKRRDVLSHVRRGDVKADLHRISHAVGIKAAQGALGKFVKRWQGKYPRAVASLLADEEELLAFFRFKDKSLWGQLRTTNAIERRFREVRRRTRPMGVFSDRTSMERILYAVFAYENLKEGTNTPFLTLTQNC
jgi:transposase-like protein